MVSGRSALRQIIRRNQPFAIHRQAGDLKTFLFRQIFEAMQHRVMFDRGGDEMPALGLEQPRRAEDRQIVALRAAAGENDFARLAAQHFGRPVASIIQQRPRLAADVMHAARDCPKPRPETAASPRAPPDPAAWWRCNRNKWCAFSETRAAGWCSSRNPSGGSAHFRQTDPPSTDRPCWNSRALPRNPGYRGPET